MPLKDWFTVATAALVLVVPATTVRAAGPTPTLLHPGTEVFPAIPTVDCAGNLDSCQPATDVTLLVGVPNLTPGLELHAGLLYLQPSADNLGYAVVTTEKNFASPVPLAQPFWTIGTLSPSYQPGFEVGGRYAFANSGNDVQVNWQHLRASTSDSVGVTQLDGQWVSPFSQTGPPTAASFDNIAFILGVDKLKAAHGQVDFDYDVVNLDFGQHVQIGSPLDVRLFAGLSYARLQEQLVSTFFGLPPDPNAVFPLSVPLSLSLDNTSTYWGIGPRLGFDSAYELPGGFRFTGQLAGALLIGRKRPAQYLFTATAPDLALVGIAVNRESINSEEFTQVVYSCDANLGIGYSHVFFNGSILTLEAGYMAAVYIDPFSGYETNNNVIPLQSGSLSTASMRHTLSDFTVNGPYLSGGFHW